MITPDKRLPSGTVIHVTIIDRRRILSAWEPTKTDPPIYYRHHNITHTLLDCQDGPDGEGVYGRLGTEVLPPDLDALPRSEERSQRVRAWQATSYERAYAAIVEAYPEAAGGVWSMGEIELPEASPRHHVLCACCGASYYSDKPQDPDRDKGYGHCESCHPMVAASWVKFGAHGPWCSHVDGSGCKTPTTEQAMAYLVSYA